MNGSVVNNSTVKSTQMNGKSLSNESLIANIRREYHDYKGGNLELTKDDTTGIATLCINCFERRNALSGVMMSQMADIITELEEWTQGKALIIYGSNGFFSSGGDLNTVRHIDNSEGGRRMAILMHNNFTRLQALPLLSVALVEGKALGGGAELTTACDFRIMTPDAAIGFVHIKLGVTTGWGGGSRLVQILGSCKALDVMMSGRLIKADEALNIGYVQHIIRDFDPNDCNSVLNKCKEWLYQYTQHNDQTLRAIKSIVNAARWLPVEEALKKEVDYFASVWGGPAHQQALAKNIKHK
ncbi:ethylmalonyl-CoA decarboxylase-like [Oppia nitens]|uniref:ethylmalonyl-CoA decarboxylase-like n=1 Tax=Oppia nitens TaxID=1686743 RepID=UPI0023DADDB3|nr:ethylmalonyl-CoA decarboxylase-like [Oppia nitens]